MPAGCRGHNNGDSDQRPYDAIPSGSDSTVIPSSDSTAEETGVPTPTADEGALWLTIQLEPSETLASTSIVVGDATGDGLPDLLVPGIRGADGWLIFAGPLSPNLEYSEGAGFISGCRGDSFFPAGDLDGDGIEDWVFRDTIVRGPLADEACDTPWLTLSWSDPTIATFSIYDVADMNADGWPDLGYASEEPFGAILYGPLIPGVNTVGPAGDGRDAWFDLSARCVVYAGPPWFSFLGDPDGDGVSDIAFGGTDAYQDACFVGFSTAVLAPPPAGTAITDPALAPSWSTQAVTAAGDVNADGLSDLLIGYERIVTGLESGDLDALAYMSPLLQISGASPVLVAIGSDVTGDGIADFIARTRDHSGSLLPGGSLGEVDLAAMGYLLDPPELAGPMLPESRHELGDLTGDGKADWAWNDWEFNIVRVYDLSLAAD